MCTYICIIGSSCPHDVKEISCLSDPCGVSSCPNHPNSVCVSSSCDHCSAHYYNSSGMDVTNSCRSTLHNCMSKNKYTKTFTMNTEQYVSI